MKNCVGANNSFGLKLAYVVDAKLRKIMELFENIVFLLLMGMVTET